MLMFAYVRTTRTRTESITPVSSGSASTRTRSCCTHDDGHGANMTNTGDASDDEREADESIECAICLEPITEATSVNLGCTHKFHGQCLVTHMVSDVRCPLCG